jgi:hypothetical protein
MPHLGAIVNQNCKKIKEKVRLKKTDLKTEVSVIVYLPLLYFNHFNLTQPMRVATVSALRPSGTTPFQSNATHAGCNSKLVQTKQ